MESDVNLLPEVRPGLSPPFARGGVSSASDIRKWRRSEGRERGQQRQQRSTRPPPPSLPPSSDRTDFIRSPLSDIAAVKAEKDLG